MIKTGCKPKKKLFVLVETALVVAVVLAVISWSNASRESVPTINQIRKQIVSLQQSNGYRTGMQCLSNSKKSSVTDNLKLTSNEHSAVNLCLFADFVNTLTPEQLSIM